MKYLLKEYNDYDRDSFIISDLYLSIDENFSVIEQIQSDHSFSYLNDLTAIENTIFNLTESEVFLTTQKDVWALEVKSKSDTLSVSDIQILDNIDDLCPLEYGSGVYDARALLVQEDYSEWSEYINNCAQPQNRISMANDVLFDNLKIAPNPSSGKIYISYPSDIEKGILYVHDIQGRLVLKDERSPVVIDLNDQIPGLYSISYHLGNNILTHKILIVE